nr:MAG: hypothetical protein [Bacteriophage sp.]
MIYTTQQQNTLETAKNAQYGNAVFLLQKSVFRNHAKVSMKPCKSDESDTILNIARILETM